MGASWPPSENLLMNFSIMAPGKTTIHDIARELSITASTVSRALKDHPRISEDTKKAVQKVAKRLNYQPNHIAAALRNGRSKILGIIVPTVDRTFFSAVVRGIEEIANQSGYNVMICQSHDDHQKEVATVEALLNARVDGIIASFAKGVENFDHYLKVKEKGIPLILFDRSHDDLGVSQVVIDDFLGGYKAVDHLIKQGCRRIAHFTGNQDVSIYRERLRGYKAALEAHGIPFDSALVVESNMQLEDGRNSLTSLLNAGIQVDGIFSSSAYGIMGAHQVLKEKGIKIPEEVALVGFSNEPFTWFSEPPITSIDQHSTQMGNAAAELFFDQLESGNKKFAAKKTVLTPELIIRTSSQRKK
jgi:LacI family transcriptional regulator